MGPTALTILVFERGINDTGIRAALERDKHDVHVAEDPLRPARSPAYIAAMQSSLKLLLEMKRRWRASCRLRWLPPSAMIVAVAKNTNASENVDRDASFDISLQLPIDTDHFRACFITRALFVRR